MTTEHVHNWVFFNDQMRECRPGCGAIERWGQSAAPVSVSQPIYREDDEGAAVHSADGLRWGTVVNGEVQWHDGPPPTMEQTRAEFDALLRLIESTPDPIESVSTICSMSPDGKHCTIHNPCCLCDESVSVSSDPQEDLVRAHFELMREVDGALGTATLARPMELNPALSKMIAAAKAIGARDERARMTSVNVEAISDAAAAWHEDLHDEVGSSFSECDREPCASAHALALNQLTTESVQPLSPACQTCDHPSHRGRACPRCLHPRMGDANTGTIDPWHEYQPLSPQEPK